jgi:hypothetical protein
MIYSCFQCSAQATWMYMPADTYPSGDLRRFCCDEHVSRGCISCNTDPDTGIEDKDEQGRLYPCCEYIYDDRGFSDE